MSTSAADAAWSASAFGLTVSGTVPVWGLTGSGAAPDGRCPTVVLRHVARRTIDAGWPRDGSRPVSRVRREGERVAALRIDAHDDAGHLFTGVGYGRFRLNAAADEVLCAPLPVAHWVRQLYGQVLPFAAGVRGLEVLHAGGLVLPGGGVLAVSGPSGAGKTTLSAALLRAGCGFLADDAVALEQRDGVVLAHPGPALSASVVPGGEELSLVDAVQAAAPLRAVCLLRRDAAHRRLEVVDAPSGDPRPLMQTVYDVVRRDPQRLLNQLDLMAAVAQRARVVELRAPLTTAPQALASTLLEALG